MKIAPSDIFSINALEDYLGNPKKVDRILLMQSGAKEFDIWFDDLFSRGIASLQSPGKFQIDAIASRLVDTQNSGLARKLRIVSSELSKDDWSEIQCIEDLLHLYLLARGLLKIDHLPPLLKSELLNMAGMNWRKKDLQWVQPIEDQLWCIYSKEQKMENLRVLNSYFYGSNTGCVAEVNQYAFRFDPFEHQIETGQWWQGGLTYYPSNSPIHAFPMPGFSRKMTALPESPQIQPNQYSIPEMRASNPYRRGWPGVFPLSKIPDLIEQNQDIKATTESGLPVLKMMKFGAIDHFSKAFGIWELSKFIPLTVIERSALIQL